MAKRDTGPDLGLPCGCIYITQCQNKIKWHNPNWIVSHKTHLINTCRIKGLPEESLTQRGKFLWVKKPRVSVQSNKSEVKLDPDNTSGKMAYALHLFVQQIWLIPHWGSSQMQRTGVTHESSDDRKGWGWKVKGESLGWYVCYWFWQSQYIWENGVLYVSLGLFFSYWIWN